MTGRTSLGIAARRAAGGAQAKTQRQEPSRKPKAPQYTGPPRSEGPQTLTLTLTLTLPYPPSVNHLWRRVGNRTLLSAEGRRYHETVAVLVRQQGGTMPPPPHLVSIVAVVPDKRRRDIDNLLKGLLDPVYRAFDVDDSVIRWLSIEKRDLDERGPRAEIEIRGY